MSKTKDISRAYNNY